MATLLSKRESGRIKDLEGGRVLDQVSRQRRQKKSLEALESDNCQDDPHSHLTPHKKAPKFEDSEESGSSRGKKKKLRGDHFKLRFRKTFQNLLDEESFQQPTGSNYQSCTAPPSEMPSRHFCSVCGFISNYTCVNCGFRYCSVACLATHKDTRCLKWTA